MEQPKKYVPYIYKWIFNIKKVQSCKPYSVFKLQMEKFEMLNETRQKKDKLHQCVIWK